MLFKGSKKDIPSDVYVRFGSLVIHDDAELEKERLNTANF